VTGEGFQDRVAASRCPLELLQIVEELGEAADEERHGVEDITGCEVSGFRGLVAFF
jgi:hypothetical protein